MPTEEPIAPPEEPTEEPTTPIEEPAAPEEGEAVPPEEAPEPELPTEPQPEPEAPVSSGPISLLIAPGPGNVGALVELNAPNLDSGDWVLARFRQLDGWAFIPEGLDSHTATPGHPSWYELLGKTPIRFRFRWKLGEVRLAGKRKALTIDPTVDDLVNAEGTNVGRLVAVRAVDGDKPILEVDLSPAVTG